MTAIIAVIIVAVLLVAALAVIAAAVTISCYNRLVALRGRLENAFAQIDVQLTRRYDLIPNIVASAKAFLAHESRTLQAVTKARNQALEALKAAAASPMTPAAVKALALAEKNLTGSLGALSLQMEAYPELKGDRVMLQLNEELAATENKVAFARQAYNDAATTYNILRNSFPASLLAAATGHGLDAELLSFENADAIRTAPSVAF